MGTVWRQNYDRAVTTWLARSNRGKFAESQRNFPRALHRPALAGAWLTTDQNLLVDLFAIWLAVLSATKRNTNLLERKSSRASAQDSARPARLRPKLAFGELGKVAHAPRSTALLHVVNLPPGTALSNRFPMSHKRILRRRISVHYRCLIVENNRHSVFEQRSERLAPRSICCRRHLSLRGSHNIS